jgi:hypothetical protein
MEQTIYDAATRKDLQIDSRGRRRAQSARMNKSKPSRENQNEPQRIAEQGIHNQWRRSGRKRNQAATFGEG